MTPNPVKRWLTPYVPKGLKRFIRACQNSEFIWRYVDNWRPSIRYRLYRPSIGGESLRVLRELNRNGIAMTSVDALLGPNSDYQELKQAVEDLEKKLADQIGAARAEAEGSKNGKNFIFSLLGACPLLDANSIFVRFGLQRSILQIANAYLGIYSRLRYYNVWHTFRSQIPPRRSQLWHCDQDDRYIFKVFVYLSEVTEGAGPLAYVPGSHAKGSLLQKPAGFLEEGHSQVRSSDAQMIEIVSESQWIRAVGPPGTIIFADTHGYHKGGLGRQQDRIMYLCMFTSQASKVRDLFARPREVPFTDDRERRFALTGEGEGK